MKLAFRLVEHPELYLEGQGDLVSRSKMGITWVSIWVIGFLNLKPKPPTLQVNPEHRDPKPPTKVPRVVGLGFRVWKPPYSPILEGL